MTTPPDHKANQAPSSIRMGARLDPTTRQQVDDLAKRFHQPRAAVLCHIMHWGVSREQIGPLDKSDAQGPVCHLYLYVASALHERIEKVATAVGMNITPWLRHMVRQMTISDSRPAGRRHDLRSAPTIPGPMADASCFGWMNLLRPNFSNSSSSLGPRSRDYPGAHCSGE